MYILYNEHRYELEIILAGSDLGEDFVSVSDLCGVHGVDTVGLIVLIQASHLTVVSY